MITHILKAICVLCTAACAAAAFTSCGSTESSSSSASSTASSATADSGSESETQAELKAKELIEKTLAEAPDDLIDATTEKGDTSDHGFDKFCKKLYFGTMPDDLADGAISYASTGGNADEISVLKAADPAKQGELTKILEQRRDMRHRDFEGYKPEELPKIENAEVFEAGGFSILVIADNADDIQKAFEKNA